MIYTLSEEDYEAARALGVLRNRWNVRKDHRNTNNFDGDIITDGDAIHALAAGAEFAFARVSGLLRNEKFSLRKEPSVGDFFVRVTKHVGGHLLVQPEDPDDALVVFAVSLDGRTFDFRGWLRFSAGKTGANWRRGQDRRPDRPAYWVRQRDLQPLHLIGIGAVPPASPPPPPPAIW